VSCLSPRDIRNFLAFKIKHEAVLVQSYFGVITAISDDFVSASLTTPGNKQYNVDIQKLVIPAENHKDLAIGTKLIWELFKEGGHLVPRLRILLF
jgi:hypothetical protein